MSQQRIAADLLARAARLRKQAPRINGAKRRAQMDAEALTIEARARKMMARAERDATIRPLPDAQESDREPEGR
jgi:hypothetical protein